MSGTRLVHRGAAWITNAGIGQGNDPVSGSIAYDGNHAGQDYDAYATFDVSGSTDPVATVGTDLFKLSLGTYAREDPACETFTATGTAAGASDAWVFLYAKKYDVLVMSASLVGIFDKDGNPSAVATVRAELTSNWSPLGVGAVSATLTGARARFDSEAVRIPATIQASAVVPATGWQRVYLTGIVSDAGASLSLADNVVIHAWVHEPMRSRGGFPSQG
jgi:hypothetical protein